MTNILIISPHPDDEVLGCGGSISKLTEMGKNVYVLIITNANKTLPERYTLEKLNNVRKESLEAATILGVKQVIFEDFPAITLNQFPTYIVTERIKKILNEFDIDTLFLPHRGDIHADHKVVFDAAMVAARPVGRQPVRQILAYETLSETEWAYPFGSEVFIPNYFIMLEEKHLKYKLMAMQSYKSQLREFPSSRSLKALNALAELRGATVGYPYAEAFALIRNIV